MSIQIRPINNKRLLCSVIVFVSLHFVFLGIRVPSILAAHSPKLHSHAVIDTSVKECQEEELRKNFADAVCHNSVKLDFPTQFTLSSQQENQKYRFILPGDFNARAPPEFAV
jgi:hypothetical protein